MLTNWLCQCGDDDGGGDEDDDDDDVGLQYTCR